MRFFLGGVPFGCDNIGDEAILAGVVRILRNDFPDAEITVSTFRQEETSKLLGVSTVPLFGFKDIPLKGLAAELCKHDVFVWAGATGLSDYPATALKILSCAQKLGLKTVVWGVGMDSRLNPAFFKLGGKKLILAKALSKCSMGFCDCVKKAERVLERRMKSKIAAALKLCDLVVVRDPETKAIIDGFAPSANCFTGADSALVFNSPDCGALNALPPEIKTRLLDGGAKKIGVCISAQRKVSSLDTLAKTLDTLLKNGNRRIFFVPMNPVTDSELMKELQKKLKHADKSYLIEGVEDFNCIVAIASKLDVVISSRLHLLILSANVGTPIVGISRGSKVDNFLGQFGLKSAGTVYDANFDFLTMQAENLLSAPERFKAAQKTVYEDLYKRLSRAEKMLRDKLQTRPQTEQ